MACNCTDLLADVEAKFDLIIELLNTIIGLIGRRIGAIDKRRPSGRPWPTLGDEKAKAFFMAYIEEEDICKFMCAIVHAGIL